MEATICFDHATLLLHMVRIFEPARQRTRFRFEACWALEDECQEILQNAWTRPNTYEKKWDALNDKLKGCVAKLLHWRSTKHDSTQVQIKKMKKQLVGLQEKDDLGAAAEAKKIQIKLQILLDKEELWWKQRAREDWLKYDDRNTKYYHACVNSKRRRNYVGSITDESGLNWNTPVEVERAFVQYFTTLFTQG